MMTRSSMASLAFVRPFDDDADLGPFRQVHGRRKLDLSVSDDADDFHHRGNLIIRAPLAGAAKNLNAEPTQIWWQFRAAGHHRT